ncbi:tripartite tricarboxylate transporter substrate binding protein [Candidimonas humi]|uniref:Tripartite tricarboxylate transporter substrate binding protein n=1 Tax=Candidimonas humi TaxID=683355 RepID=A0ABV8NVP9_9BURK
MISTRSLFVACATLIGALSGISTSAAPNTDAGDWPKQAVTLVVPFAPGGGTDSIAREFAQELSKSLGRSVIVENRGGGGGSIGAARVAHAKPDGYTLLFATSTFATNAAWEGSKAYNPRADFTPIALLGSGPLMLVANKNLGIDSVSDLLKQIHDKPGTINYCSAGPGSINHLSGALFQQKTGTNISHVPYRGSGPATMDLLAGRVQIFFSTMPTMLEQARAGNVKVLAVTTATRSSLFPAVPTLDEAGVKGFDISTWWGLLGPAKLPADIVAKLNAATNKITGQALVRDRLHTEGATIFHGSPADFRNKLNTELAMWQGVVQRINHK